MEKTLEIELELFEKVYGIHFGVGDKVLLNRYIVEVYQNNFSPKEISRLIKDYAFSMGYGEESIKFKKTAKGVKDMEIKIAEELKRQKGLSKPQFYNHSGD